MGGGWGEGEGGDERDQMVMVVIAVMAVVVVMAVMMMMAVTAVTAVIEAAGEVGGGWVGAIRYHFLAQQILARARYQWRSAPKCPERCT